MDTCSPADSEGPSLQGWLIPKGSKQLSREHTFPRQTNQPRAHSPRLLHRLPPSGPPSTCPLHPGQIPYNQGRALCPGACGNDPNQPVFSCPPCSVLMGEQTSGRAHQTGEPVTHMDQLSQAGPWPRGMPFLKDSQLEPVCPRHCRQLERQASHRREGWGASITAASARPLR